ncbi:MAG: RNA methyltransferase, partial [Gemmatimonadetes bacterium]|nr:RNA methyltransferase [Gemmatimonadota bacterium]
GRILLLDGLQDPGNVGTLIRTAWALDLTQVWTTRGCSDPWGSKAVRASAGAVFHLDIVGVGEADGGLAETQHRVWVADAAGTPITHVPDAGGTDWVLAVGNEGAGVSAAVRSLGPGVSIPMSKGADSLNVAVAGSILMYVLVQAGRDGDV